MSKKRKRLSKASDLREGQVSPRTLLAPETDRGCVLIASEMLSDSLSQLFEELFKKHQVSRKASDELLKNVTAPLFSFGMRLKFAKAFGLLRTATSDALDDIRKIRNLCAHGVGGVHLDDEDIRPLVANLKKYLLSGNPRFAGRIEKFGTLASNGDVNGWKTAGGDITTYSSERYIFMDTVMMIHLSIHVSIGAAMQGEMINPILHRQLFGRKKPNI